MERVFLQAEGGTTEGLQGFVERHGTKASVRRGKRETEQVEARGIGRRGSCQSVPAAAQQVLNRSANGELKALYRIDLTSAAFRAYDDPQGLVTIGKELLYDALPDMEASSIFTAEKLEGFAVTADGRAYAVSDNDGVDDAPGETLFLRLGPWDHLDSE